MLDDQQRELVRESMQKHADELRKIQEKLRQAQRELMQAVLAEKQDEKVIREKADAVGKVQTELTLLQAKIFAPVVPTLKPEQRDMFENSPFALGMMAGGFGGMGGGGRFMDRGGAAPGDRRGPPR